MFVVFALPLFFPLLFFPFLSHYVIIPLSLACFFCSNLLFPLRHNTTVLFPAITSSNWALPLATHSSRQKHETVPPLHRKYRTTVAGMCPNPALKSSVVYIRTPSAAGRSTCIKGHRVRLHSSTEQCYWRSYRGSCQHLCFPSQCSPYQGKARRRSHVFEYHQARV